MFEKLTRKKGVKNFTVVQLERPSTQKCKKIVHPIRKICQSFTDEQKTHVINTIVMQNVGAFQNAGVII